MHTLIKQLQDYLPPLFAETELNRLLGNSISWKTIQNMRSNPQLPAEQKPPEECFIKLNGKVLIVRDNFLKWWLKDVDEKQPINLRN